jgi:pimeloyl-ACP methyl ester carboxylesterase
MGGINAMLYAARHPQAVAALVVVDTGPSIRREGAQRVAEFVLGAGEVESLEALVERAQAFNPRRDPRLLRRSLLHNLRKRPDGGWTWKYDRRHLSKEQFERLASRLAGLREEVSNIAAPTLVLRGADSDVFSDQDARELAQALPDGRWERVEAAGHTVQGDNPAGLAAALRRFFRDIGAEAPASLGEPGQS